MKSYLRGALGALAVAALVAGLQTAAWADCKPLTMVVSVDMDSAGFRNLRFAPVTLGGVSKLMLIDTGGSDSEISNNLAETLKLPLRHSNNTVYGMTGPESETYTMTSFRMGVLTSKNQEFMVSRDKIYENDRVGGLLAPDILHNFDVDLDFGANKLTLLSPDHCKGKVVYWPHQALAIVPMQILRSGHVMIRVMLDGKSLNAMVDTGAPRSTLTVPAAVNYFGLKLGSADTPEAGTLGDGSSKVYKHIFKLLDFDGIAVSNPDLEIVPNYLGDLVASEQVVGTHIANPGNSDDKIDMLIGMDILKHLHLYIAYQEQNLYITPATAPAATAPQAAAK